MKTLFLPFSAFCTKNCEKAYFEQHLEYAALKPCSKYTTIGVNLNVFETKPHQALFLLNYIYKWGCLAS